MGARVGIAKEVYFRVRVQHICACHQRSDQRTHADTNGLELLGDKYVIALAFAEVCESEFQR